MTTQAHTPTPWTTKLHGSTNTLVIEHDGLEIAIMNSFHLLKQENAEFIITACNAYDANQALIVEQSAEIARLRGALVKIEEETDDDYTYEIAHKALQAQEVAK